MKIALITDLHFGARGDARVVLDHQRKFYDEIFFPYLREHDIKTVICLGDVFDRRKFTNHVTMYESRKFFAEQLASNGIDTHIMVGNHDAAYKNTNRVNSCDLLFHGFDNIKVYSEAEEVEFGSTKILFVPWINSSNYERTMDMIVNTKAECLFGHLEIVGFHMYKYSVNDSHGFDQSLFNKFDIVCSGHYHHKSTQSNIHYLGSPYEMTWSDYDDYRGFHVFDSETRELEYVQNPLRLFHKIIYDDSIMSHEELFEIDTTQFKDCFVKIIAKNKTNPYLFDKFIDRLEKAQPFNLQVVEDYVSLTPDDDNVDEAQDTVDILNSYVSSLDLGDNKETVLKLIHELYEESINDSI